MEQESSQSPSAMPGRAYDDDDDESFDEEASQGDLSQADSQNDLEDQSLDEEEEQYQDDNNDEPFDNVASQSHLSRTNPQDDGNESVHSHVYGGQSEPHNDEEDHNQIDEHESQQNIISHPRILYPMLQPSSSASMPSHPYLNRTNSSNPLQTSSSAGPSNIITVKTADIGQVDGWLSGKAQRVNFGSSKVHQYFQIENVCELTGEVFGIFQFDSDAMYAGQFKGNQSSVPTRKQVTGFVFEGRFVGHFSGNMQHDAPNVETYTLSGSFSGKLKGRFVGELNYDSNRPTSFEDSYFTTYRLSNVYFLSHPFLNICDNFCVDGKVNGEAHGLLCLDQPHSTYSLHGNLIKIAGGTFKINCVVGFCDMNGSSKQAHPKLFNGTVYNGSFAGPFSGSIDMPNENGCCFSGTFGGIITGQFVGSFHDVPQIYEDHSFIRTVALTQANGQLSTFDNQNSHQANDPPSDDHALEDNQSGTAPNREGPAATIAASVNDQVNQSNLDRPAESNAESGNETNNSVPPTQADEQPRRKSPRISEITSNNTANDSNHNEEEEEPSPPVKKTRVKPSRKRTSEQPGTSGQQQRPAIREQNDEEEVPSPPVKRTQVKPSRSRTVEQPGTSGRQQRPVIREQNDEEAPPDKCITESLKCPNCGKMFDKTKFQHHMLKEYSILPNRCLFKDCGQSFVDSFELGKHCRKAHPNMVNWKCTDCPKKYLSHRNLSQHFFKNHTIGQFRCSFPGCHFVNEIPGKVYSHYNNSHRELLVCQHPGCQYTSHHKNHFMTHQRKHTGNKPYKCNWSGCLYSTSDRGSALRHIEGVHFGGSQTIVKRGVKRSRQYYLKIVKELL